MFDWIKKLVVEKFVGLGIGYVTSHLLTGAVSAALAANGVSVDPVKVQAGLWAGYESLAHLVETKVAGTRWEWIGKVL